MEVRTNFETFKSGDKVRVNKEFPYIDHELFSEECYIIMRMISDAGVVTIEGFPYNITFPDEAFQLIEDN